MGSSENGIRNSPFSDAWPTPDVSGTGLNGLGNGNIDDSGSNGLTASPWTPPFPTPGISETPCPELGQPSPDTISVDGGSPKGSQLPDDITWTNRNTIDRR